MKKVYVILALVLLVSVTSQAWVVTNAAHTGILKNDGTAYTVQGGNPLFGVSTIKGFNPVSGNWEDKPIGSASTPRSTVIMGVNQADPWAASPWGLTNGSVLPTQAFPGYLIGGEQVTVANNNRNLADYQLTLTLNQAADVYVLVDNRAWGYKGTNPPGYGTNPGDSAGDERYTDPDIQGWTAWLGSWTRVNTGICINGAPDYVAMDDSSPYDGKSSSEFYAIYKKTVTNGTVTLGAQGTGNMYSVVVQPIPEPATMAILGLGGLALLRRKK